MPSVIQTAGDVVGSVSHHVQHAAKSVEAQLEATTNQLLPPRRREHMAEQARLYARQNPKAAVCSPLTTQKPMLMNINRLSSPPKPRWRASPLSSF